jgi:DNA polymerase-4
VPPTTRHIAHFDLDAFFVSVELLKNPALKGKPLIVGGDGQRGIVAACSYEARKFGIQSAMPALTDRRLCPQAIFLKGSYHEYSHYSRMVTHIIADAVPVYKKRLLMNFIKCAVKSIHSLRRWEVRHWRF